MVASSATMVRGHAFGSERNLRAVCRLLLVLLLVVVPVMFDVCIDKYSYVCNKCIDVVVWVLDVHQAYFKKRFAEFQRILKEVDKMSTGWTKMRIDNSADECLPGHY